jgi:hypothetical protein
MRTLGLYLLVALLTLEIGTCVLVLAQLAFVFYSGAYTGGLGGD